MQNLDIREFCWLVHHLPAESASKGAWTALDENVATMTDLMIDGAITSWQRNTFDPERWPAHRKRAEQAKRSTKPPSALPHVAPVAMRPEGVNPLTAIFTLEPPDKPAKNSESVESDAPRPGDAHDQLAQFIASL